MKPITNRTSRPLTIDETGQHVGPGETVDVDDDVADRLLEQPDVWGGPHVCDVCDYPAASAGGLATHKRTHQTDEETDR